MLNCGIICLLHNLHIFALSRENALVKGAFLFSHTVMGGIAQQQ